MQKTCPLRVSAGFQNARQMCNEDCAWFINGRCAVADIADSLSMIAMDVAAQE